MRIVTEDALKAFADEHPGAAAAVRRLVVALRGAEWRNLAEMRKVFPHADLVHVSSGHSVVVLNLAGNDYRVITAPHFNRSRIYILAVLTHREYSRGAWKETL